MNDRPFAEASTYTTQETNFRTLKGIQIRDPRNRDAADLRLRPHRHRNRLAVYGL
jgi:hypothetical protein